MLNSKVGEKSFVNFIERNDKICLDVDKNQYIKLDYTFFVSEQNKKKVTNILEAYKEYTDNSILNYYLEESVAFCEGKLETTTIQVNVEMLFRKVHKDAKVLFFNISKEIIAFKDYIKEYIEERYPQEFAIHCCFSKYDLQRHVSSITKYLNENEYFRLLAHNQFIKGVENYNYTVELARNFILFKGYSGNISKIGVKQAFYEIIDYLITLDKELISKIKG